MKIMEVKNNDLERLKEIAETAMMNTVSATTEEKIILLKSIKSDIEEFFFSQNRIYLKIEDEGIKGYILIKEFWNLAHLFVEPACHNQGFGAKLLKRGIEICKQKNEHGFIRVNSSRNALGFYEHSGFSHHIAEKPLPEFAVPLIYNY